MTRPTADQIAERIAETEGEYPVSDETDPESEPCERCGIPTRQNYGTYDNTVTQQHLFAAECITRLRRRCDEMVAYLNRDLDKSK